METTTNAAPVGDIVLRLRERAMWLESRSFARLTADIEREAADVIEGLEGRRYFDCTMRGWPSFGFGRLRLYFTETTWYTLWVFFLTKKFSVAFHFGGKSSP